MGVRRTWAGSPSRFTSRASIEGVARPVTVTKKRWSTSAGPTPARFSASRTAASPRSVAAAIQASLALAKVSSAGYWASGRARWRPDTCTERWRSARRSTLKCSRAHTPCRAAMSCSWVRSAAAGRAPPRAPWEGVSRASGSRRQWGRPRSPLVTHGEHFARAAMGRTPPPPGGRLACQAARDPYVRGHATGEAHHQGPGSDAGGPGPGAAPRPPGHRRRAPAAGAPGAGGGRGEAHARQDRRRPRPRRLARRGRAARGGQGPRRRALPGEPAPQARRPGRGRVAQAPRRVRLHRAPAGGALRGAGRRRRGAALARAPPPSACATRWRRRARAGG